MNTVAKGYCLAMRLGVYGRPEPSTAIPVSRTPVYSGGGSGGYNVGTGRNSYRPSSANERSRSANDAGLRNKGVDFSSPSARASLASTQYQHGQSAEKDGRYCDALSWYRVAMNNYP